MPRRRWGMKYALEIGQEWPPRPAPALTDDLLELEFSAHTHNRLEDAGVLTVGDLVGKSPAELLEIPRFGKFALLEVGKVLESCGLALRSEV